MRHLSGARLRFLLAAASVALASRAHAQASRPPAPAARSVTHYSGREADFVVGKTVYLRSTKTPIGTIESADASHAFPRSFPQSPAKAVLIRRVDGPKSWVPVAGISRIYVVAQ